MTHGKVHYYTPLFMRGQGWYFIVPACDVEGEGDRISAVYVSKEACAAVIRLCTDGVTHHNDNMEARHEV